MADTGSPSDARDADDTRFIQLLAFRSYAGTGDTLMALDEAGQVWELQYDIGPGKSVWRRKPAEVDRG